MKNVSEIRTIVRIKNHIINIVFVFCSGEKRLNETANGDDVDFEESPKKKKKMKSKKKFKNN